MIRTRPSVSFSAGHDLELQIAGRLIGWIGQSFSSAVPAHDIDNAMILTFERELEDMLECVGFVSAKASCRLTTVYGMPFMWCEILVRSVHQDLASLLDVRFPVKP